MFEVDEQAARRRFAESRHWVVKLGSNVLLNGPDQLDRPVFAALVQGLERLMRAGKEVTVVSSGAVALGRQALRERSDGKRHIPRLQALAAIGQPRLLKLYEEEFYHYDRTVAQLLFTRDDLNDRSRYLNARHAVEAINALGAVAIINENDTLATEELRFGDNDQLAAMTCGLVSADVLVILSDVDGIFEVEEDERGGRRFTERIPMIGAQDERLTQIAGPSISGVGTGGMMTKVLAAQIASRFGVPTVIAPGKRVGVLEDLARGESVGTLLLAQESGLSGRKVWLSAGALPTGRIWCDAGAQRAVLAKGASLLPCGITRVEGGFEEGDVVELTSASGEVFAVGLSVYNSAMTRELIGAQTEEIEVLLGFKLLDCVVHRDNLVVHDQSLAR